MAKPILLGVDDDSDVLRAIERDLRSQYGAQYRVIGSDSPDGALELLKQLKLRNDSAALLLADQRMPRMDGVEFLREAAEIFPGAKRALLPKSAELRDRSTVSLRMRKIYSHEERPGFVLSRDVTLHVNPSSVLANLGNVIGELHV
jgi:CheY-like chemotaxis protein